MTRRELVIGLGASGGVTEASVLAMLESLPVRPEEVVGFATIDRKTGEPGLVSAVRRWAGGTLHGYPAAALAAVGVPSPSAVVCGHVGTPSVAEAAALLAARARGPAELIVHKRRSVDVTAAVAELSR